MEPRLTKFQCSHPGELIWLKKVAIRLNYEELRNNGIKGFLNKSNCHNSFAATGSVESQIQVFKSKILKGTQ